MKTLSAIVFGLALCICSQSFAQQGYFGHNNFYGSGCCNTWEFKSSLLILDLDQSSNNTVLATDANLNTTLLTAGQLSGLDTGVGIDTCLTYKDSTDVRWEFRNVFSSWDGGSILTGNASISNVFSTPANANQLISGPNRLDLFSLELMRKQSVCQGVTLFAGPKFVSLSDDLRITTASVIGAVNFNTSNQMTVDNLLWGGAFGADFNLQVTRNLQVETTVQGGYYANPMKFNSITSDSITSGQTNTNQRETTDALSFEITSSVIWEIFPDAVSVEAGYHAMWFDGVGRSYGQIVNNTTDIATETLFAHGARFGVIFKRK